MTLDDVDARLAELAASDDEDAIVAIDALLDSPRTVRSGTRRRAMAWETSTRRQRLPADWTRRREAVKTRARGMCETGCGRPGSECDHIIPGDDHGLANLQWLCADCHRRKTAREAALRNQQLVLRHKVEPHPGIAGPVG